MNLSMKRIALRVARRAVFVWLVAGALVVGCGTKDNTRSLPEALKTDLLSRWNAVGDSVTVKDFGTFHWGNFDQFPHPTYKGGSAEAYQSFADLLVTFFDRGDNFVFLSNNLLFRFPFHYISPSGQSLGEWTFEELTTQFASNDWASISAETRQKLQAFATRIQTAP